MTTSKDHFTNEQEHSAVNGELLPPQPELHPEDIFQPVTLPSHLEDIASWDKEKIQIMAEELSERVLQGDVNPLTVKIALRKMTEILDAVNKATEDAWIDEARKHGKSFKHLGCQIEVRSTGDRYKFDDDPQYAIIKGKLKQREDLLKTAAKSSHLLVDEDTGEPVPKVQIIPGKETIAISIK